MKTLLQYLTKEIRYLRKIHQQNILNTQLIFDIASKEYNYSIIGYVLNSKSNLCFDTEISKTSFLINYKDIL